MLAWARMIRSWLSDSSLNGKYTLAAGGMVVVLDLNNAGRIRLSIDFDPDFDFDFDNDLNDRQPLVPVHVHVHVLLLVLATSACT
jgi:hypothetical protein